MYGIRNINFSHNPQAVFFSMLLLLILTLTSTFSYGISNHANQFYVCSAYKSGPFIIDESKRLGLLYTFTDFLNAQAQGKYQFDVLLLPRGRLLLELQTTNHCIVPFVSYQWFDPSKALYNWSQPIIEDANVILSSQATKLESLAKEKVVGLRTSQVIGFFDDQLETLIKDKTVIRFDSISLEKSVGMVAKHRIDFIVSGRIPLQYLINKHHLEDKVYLSKKTTATFNRSVMSPKYNAELSEFIAAQIEPFKVSAAWEQSLIELGIKHH